MNNSKVKDFMKNFSYTIISNLISLMVSMLVVLIVPKLIGVKEYGYWQLYLFYSSYVGFMHFGWSDGIYLRFGGKEYKELDRRIFFSQFYMQVILQVIIGLIISIIASLFISDEGRIFILQMTAISLFIINVRQMLLLVLQATNRIKEYARATMAGRLIYLLLVALFLMFGIRDYKTMIIADLFGKFLSLFLVVFYCKELVFNKISLFIFDVKEAYSNIKVGINLMIANIASTLIIGVVRFGIERSWNVETFGKVSLTLSLSGLMMLFINAIGIVIFPILRRIDQSRLPNIYVTIRDFLMISLIGFIIIYYPLKGFLTLWLPNYVDSLKYMALIFPMSVYEGKVVLLINTYLKTLRKERLMLKINLISLFFSIILTILSTALFNNLNFAVLSIVIVIAFRCIFAEIILTRYLKIHIYKDMILELFITISFILLGWFTVTWVGFVCYTLIVLFYTLIKKKDLIKTVSNLKVLIKT